MQIYLGEKGLNASWQEPFPKKIKCHQCGNNCRVMFVAMEENEKEYVCNLHANNVTTKKGKLKKNYNNPKIKGHCERGLVKGKYWPHDAIACAVYLCEKCFEPNALLNQA